MNDLQRSIKDIHKARSGKVSDKWESYLDYYDLLFAPIRDQSVSLLEIGIQNGGSLETYSEYFRNGVAFVGCDINERCRQLSYDDPRVKVIVGDANTDSAWSEVVSASSLFDLIIDDGSHMSMDILNSFIRYFPLVKPGGIYVVEDTHCVYSPKYGGGILNEFSAISFFKKLADVVSFQWWSDDVSMPNLLTTFFRDGVPAFIGDGWVESIEFRNSIITVRKSQRAGHEKLGNRLMCGSDYSVFDWRKV